MTRPASAETAPASSAAASGLTINAMFAETVARHGDKTALLHKTGGKDGTWTPITYNELAERVRRVAGGLRALGVNPGDRVALLSENRPEWAITDLAVLALGAIVVPIYATLPAPQVQYILQDSGSKVLVLSDAKQLKKANEARSPSETPDLAHIVVMDASAAPDGGDPAVRPFASLEEQNGAAAPFEAIPVTGDDVASFVYTSGTTGNPKGAMLSHANFVTDVTAAVKHFEGSGLTISADDIFLSFLPLSHVYERMAGHYLPLSVGATIAYAESLFAVQGNMAEIQPTIMVSMPRLYEAIQERITDAVNKAPEKRQKLFRRALAVGVACAERRQTGKNVGPLLVLQRALWDKLVFAKVRERFGGRLRVFVSGGAALANDTTLFFDAIGAPILQGYGMTESSPVISANPWDKPRLGTVGKAIPGVEVKIAGDGEILVRGPIVMKGYWNNPDATAESVKDGWLHTGDIGRLDDEYLTITDRKKDILVLANGKNVAPQPIEGALKASPFINEVVLIGDRQNSVSALVVPALERLRDWATKEGLQFDGSNAALIALPEAKKKIKQEIDQHSTHLADFEKIKRFTLLSTPFSVEAGELTPTLKVKRKVIAQKYAQQIAEMRGD
jgi:long-chain acyl-CoA synthetase